MVFFSKSRDIIPKEKLVEETEIKVGLPFMVSEIRYNEKQLWDRRP
jgi:hypothetical protein